MKLTNEQAVQTIVKSILQTQPVFSKNCQEPYIWKCPFCKGWFSEDEMSNPRDIKLENIPHKDDCSYILAKQLIKG